MYVLLNDPAGNDVYDFSMSRILECLFLEIIRASEKCINMTFLEVDIFHRWEQAQKSQTTFITPITKQLLDKRNKWMRRGLHAKAADEITANIGRLVAENAVPCYRRSLTYLPYNCELQLHDSSVSLGRLTNIPALVAKTLLLSMLLI